VEISADSSAGYDDGLGGEAELTDPGARGPDTTRQVCRLENSSGDEYLRVIGLERGDLVTRSDPHPVEFHDTDGEGLNHPGPVPQMMWKRGTELP
jgi:hypothetical protein